MIAVVNNLPAGHTARLYNRATGNIVASGVPSGTTSTITTALSIASAFVLVSDGDGKGIAASAPFSTAAGDKTLDYADDILNRPRAGKFETYFDDNERGVFTLGSPIFREFGVAVVHPIITNRPGSDGQNTWDDIREAYEEGHDIASHSATHTVSVTSANAATEVAPSYNALKAQGILDPIRWCGPFGTGDGLPEVAAFFCSSTGGTTGTLNALYPASMFQLARIDSHQGLIGVKTAIDNAAAQGKYALIMQHGITLDIEDEDPNGNPYDLNYWQDVAYIRQEFAHLVSSNVEYTRLEPHFEIEFDGTKYRVQRGNRLKTPASSGGWVDGEGSLLVAGNAWFTPTASIVLTSGEADKVRTLKSQGEEVAGANSLGDGVLKMYSYGTLVWEA